MSRRPIRMLGLYGLHRLWHANKGLTATSRNVCVRAYPTGCNFQSADEFEMAFRSIVGYFGANGRDLPNWEEWVDGTACDKSEAV